MGEDDRDAVFRAAAFEAVRGMVRRGSPIPKHRLAEGFIGPDGARHALINPQRGIHKPTAMPFLLAIVTVTPGKGRKVWYEDQRGAHDEIFAAGGTVSYSFQGTDPEAYDNRWMREACERQVPIIYFLGVAPGLYEPVMPAFIVGFDAAGLKATVAFGLGKRTAAGVAVPSEDERRYAMRLTKQRLHQEKFRLSVIDAYGGRCAVTGLPERRLLDAAHIVPDADEEMGQPIIANGIPLSKIHHAAYDANLIGIDADGKVHVSPRLFEMNDGPLLEHGIKGMHGRIILPPRMERHRPDRARLALRFEEYRRAS